MRYVARRLKVVNYIADHPGQFPIVYRHYDDIGRLLYVGRTMASLPKVTVSRAKPFTLLDHNTRKPALYVIMRNHLEKSWFNIIKTVTIERFPNREAAANAERQAIRREKPLYNKMLYIHS